MDLEASRILCLNFLSISCLPTFSASLEKGLIRQEIVGVDAEQALGDKETAVTILSGSGLFGEAIGIRRGPAQAPVVLWGKRSDANGFLLLGGNAWNPHDQGAGTTAVAAEGTALVCGTTVPLQDPPHLQTGRMLSLMICLPI